MRAALPHVSRIALLKEWSKAKYFYRYWKKLSFSPKAQGRGPQSQRRSLTGHGVGLRPDIPAAFHFVFLGGQAGSDQRIYYINTRELTGNKYGTPNPVPFRVVDQRAGIDIKSLQYLMGHSSASVTLDVYTHTDYNSVKHAFDQIAANL